ncbi:hypothetical protein BCR42DRAFT_441177 [Absidia repens]|uniref:Uncharacterized protein n=1 Tax=Absidia repens TaxID=90262 RepID=A0A1X2I6U5_9FUNG|nr:hypothetical protein BCR42DRAFT_441177 [Absidia repens]
MDFHHSSKRIHSPTDEYNIATIIPGQSPARKKAITDDMFTNKMAGLSLAHSNSTDRNIHQDPSRSSGNNNNNGSRWRKDLVERVDDIDQFLGTDGNNSMDDEDTYLGEEPELVGVATDNTVLPFERIPGATGLRIPDFVIHATANSNNSNDDIVDHAVYEMARKQLHQHHDHFHAQPPTLPSPPQSIDADPYQPMDLD